MEDIDIKMEVEVEDDANVIEEELDEGTKEVPEAESGVDGLSACGKEQIVEVCGAMEKLKTLVLDLLNYFPEYMPRTEEKKLLNLPFQDKKVLNENDVTELKNVLEIRMYGQEYENFGLSKLEFSLEENKDTEDKLEKLLTKICTLNDKLVPYVDHVKKKVERKKAGDKKDQPKEKSDEGWGGKKRDPQTKDTTKYPIKGLTDKDVSPIRGEFDMMKTLQKVEKSKDEDVSKEKRLSRKELDMKKKIEEKDKSPIREGFNMRNLIRKEEFGRGDKSEGENEKLDLLQSAIEKLKSNIQAAVKKDEKFEFTKDYEFFMGMFIAEAKKWNMDEKMEHIENFDVSEFVTTKFSRDETYKIEERTNRITKYNESIESEYSIQHPIDPSKDDSTKDATRGKSSVKEKPKGVRRNRADEGDLLDEVLKMKESRRGRRSISRSRRSKRRSWSRGRRSRSRGRRSRSRGRRSRSREYVQPFADVQPGAALGGVMGFNGMSGTGGLGGMPGGIAAGNLGLTLDGLQNYIAGLQNLVAKQQNNQQNTMGGQQNYMGQQQNMINNQQNYMDGYNNTAGFQTNMGGGINKNMGGITRNEMQRNLNAPVGNSRNDMGGEGCQNMPSMRRQDQMEPTRNNLTKYISDKLDRPQGMNERQNSASRQKPLLDAPYMDQTGGRYQSEEVVFGERLPSDRMKSETRFGPGFQDHNASAHDERRYGSEFPADLDRREDTRFGSGFPESNSRPGVNMRGGNDLNSRQGVDMRGGNSRPGVDMRGGNSRAGADMKVVGIADMRGGSGGSGMADYGASQSRSWPTTNSGQGSARMTGTGNNYKLERPLHGIGMAGEEQKGKNWKQFMTSPSSSNTGFQNNTIKPHQRY